MACCKPCCGCKDCAAGEEGKCCCGGAEGACCNAGQFCCNGNCVPPCGRSEGNCKCDGTCCTAEQFCCDGLCVEEPCVECQFDGDCDQNNCPCDPGYARPPGGGNCTQICPGGCCPPRVPCVFGGCCLPGTCVDPNDLDAPPSPPGACVPSPMTPITLPQTPVSCCNNTCICGSDCPP